MTPQVADFLAAADKALAQSRGVLGIDYADQAARLAYYAIFHAAQAYVLHRTGDFAKTHKGMRRVFSNTYRSEPGFDARLTKALANSYRFKQSADYETGSASTVSKEEAADAIALAETFVESIHRLLILPPAAD